MDNENKGPVEEEQITLPDELLANSLFLSDHGERDIPVGKEDLTFQPEPVLEKKKNTKETALKDQKDDNDQPVDPMAINYDGDSMESAFDKKIELNYYQQVKKELYLFMQHRQKVVEKVLLNKQDNSLKMPPFAIPQKKKKDTLNNKDKLKQLLFSLPERSIMKKSPLSLRKAKVSSDKTTEKKLTVETEKKGRLDRPIEIEQKPIKRKEKSHAFFKTRRNAPFKKRATLKKNSLSVKQPTIKREKLFQEIQNRPIVKPKTINKPFAGDSLMQFDAKEQKDTFRLNKKISGSRFTPI